MNNLIKNVLKSKENYYEHQNNFNLLFKYRNQLNRLYSSIEYERTYNINIYTEIDLEWFRTPEHFLPLSFKMLIKECKLSYFCILNSTLISYSLFVKYLDGLPFELKMLILGKIKYEENSLIYHCHNKIIKKMNF